MNTPSKEDDPLTRVVIGAAIDVHKALGPGLLESTYQHCLNYELKLRGVRHEMEVPLPVMYKGVSLDCGYRMDLVVEDRLIVELKSVSEVAEIHKAQLLTYMKLAGISTELILNFNVKILKEGITRLKL